MSGLDCLFFLRYHNDIQSVRQACQTSHFTNILTSYILLQDHNFMGTTLTCLPTHTSR